MTSSGQTYDAIVVGSGPGGASVARGLSLGGRKVLILEWGDNDPVKGSVWQTIPRGLIPGRSLLITGQGLGMVRGITTGGSSLLYCATAFDPPVDMLKSHGVDISGETARIRNEIPMAPLSDELMSPAGRSFYESALDLGYDCRRLNKFIFQDKCRPHCQRCLYGCPHGAKWNARNLVDEALENGADMINRAKVRNVIIENGKAVGVVFRRKGESRRVHASTVVIAAGGIGSPMILRNSGFRGVGRDFFFDPLIYVLGKVKGVEGGRGVPMCAGVHFPEDGIVMTDFNLPHLMKIAFDLEVFRFGKAFSHAGVVPIMIKVRDGLGGKIIKDGWIWKTLKKQDKQKLAKGAAHAAKILKNAGARKVYRSWVLAAHPGGTVKIGEHVDSNLRTKYENLYVCDCSVIPREWGLPPTFTLLALGKRLAGHLAGEAREGVEERPYAEAA